MARVITLVKDITPATTRPWTAKVTVIEKAPIREARGSPTKFLKFILLDSEGTKVQMTLFNNGINMFKDRLQLFTTYYISNAIVKPVSAKFPFEGSPFQWNLHAACLIEEVNNAELPINKHVYTFTSVDNLFQYKDATTPIDVAEVDNLNRFSKSIYARY